MEYFSLVSKISIPHSLIVLDDFGRMFYDSSVSASGFGDIYTKNKAFVSIRLGTQIAKWYCVPIRALTGVQLPLL